MDESHRPGEETGTELTATEAEAETSPAEPADEPASPRTPDESMSRRTFLLWAAGISVGFTALASGWMVYEAVLPPGRSVEGKTKVGPLAIAKLDELEEGVPVLLEYGDDVVFVAKQPDGSALVFNAACPHVGCKLSWNEAADEFECPCHDSGFHPDGTLAYGPAGRDMIVAVYEIDDDGNVVVSGFEG